MREVGPVSLDEVYDVLSERLGSLRTDPPKRRYGRVFVGSIEEARGRSFDFVFLPGLAEGLFPRRALEDPLLLDDQRVKLSPDLGHPGPSRGSRTHVAPFRRRSRRRIAWLSPIRAWTSRKPAPACLLSMRSKWCAPPKAVCLPCENSRSAPLGPRLHAWIGLRQPTPATPSTMPNTTWPRCSASLKLRGAAGTGSARYLMQTNDALARSLRTRGRRWRNRWFDADGIVDPDPATLDALQTHRLANRSYSPSSLQHFAACPYRFALHAVFQFRPREEPAPLEQMDAAHARCAFPFGTI